MSAGHDVVVVGATAAGVCAAVAASGAGASVALLAAGRHVGGMVSGGLGYTDVGDVRVLGGLAARFRRDVATFYGVPEGHYAGPEPRVAEKIFTRWLEEAGVDVRLDEPLVEVSAADGVVREVRTSRGTYSAAVFVDATYEGDLLDGAGVPSSVGREDVALYGESLAGRREIVPGMHVMPAWVSPYVGDEHGTRGALEGLPLLPQIRPGGLAPVGSGDGGVMSYGYRLCLTQAPDRVPFTRSPVYDDAYWELGRRLFRHWESTGSVPPAGRLLGLEQNLPHGKADGNSLGPFSVSVLDGAAWEYPTADPIRREELRLHHLHHARDLLWFLSHDEGVPAGVRAEMSTWGLPADEFVDTEHLPHQLYVREARRMHGVRTLTQHDLAAGRVPDDTVALGSYHIDIREVQRSWQIALEHPDPRGLTVTEGYLSVAVPHYGIGYAHLVPRREHCRNLVVPVCVSASHVAFSSVRMEVQYEMLGHAAGVAAALAARAGQDVQDVDVAVLRDALAADGQVLAL